MTATMNAVLFVPAQTRQASKSESQMAAAA
jgi:hypothetical protein